MLWYHPECADAEANIALDGQEDLDDVNDQAVTWDGWRKAADEKRLRRSQHPRPSGDERADRGPDTRRAPRQRRVTDGLLGRAAYRNPTPPRRFASPACRWCGASQGTAAHHLRHCAAPTTTQTRLEPQRRAVEALSYGERGCQPLRIPSGPAGSTPQPLRGGTSSRWPRPGTEWPGVATLRQTWPGLGRLGQA